MHASASATSFRNRSVDCLLQAYSRIYLDPDEAIELCTRQSSLSVTAKDLA